jgi:phenylpropionate dioxygenase-like ring-hydroxylating dioxygenase large terminal subunit
MQAYSVSLECEWVGDVPMYPFKQGCFAPKNAWYVAANRQDVGRALLGRTVVNTPLVIYRTQGGEAVVLDGRCPHRHFPLAHSALEGDTVRCGYHGFVFGADGQCVEVPSQDHVPRACRVRKYPSVEHGLWLWVWVGDEDKADPALLPPLAEIGLEGEGLEARPMIFHEVACRYQLLNDNLFDLSHLAFLHATSIGTRENASAPEELVKRPGFVSSMRHIRNAPVPALHGELGGYPRTTQDRTMGMASYLPGFHAGLTEIRYPLDHAHAAGKVISRNWVYHTITPSTPRTCYYHFGMAMRPGEDFAMVARALAPVIDEDIFASVEIEKIIDLYDGTPPPELMVKSDTNAVEGRRMIQAMMDAEGQGG